MVRFAVAPPPPKGPRPEPFAAQLALSRVHSRLVPMRATSNGFQIESVIGEGWSELSAGRGLAGYGLARALRMLLDALAGLSALHATHADNARPFVHGELVPALLRVDETGVTRLIPLAPWHTSAPGMPAAEQRWAHLAPERLLGDAIEQRADVFSAGVLLWEALAGRRLFAGCSVDEIITRLMGGKVMLPPLPPELGWANGLEGVAQRALSVDPALRFENGAELADAIEAVARGQVASHAEVAAYFGARDPHARPSVIEALAEVPTHNSSLSALVSPVQPSESSAPPREPRALRDANAPRGTRSQALWVAVAGVTVLAVLGVSSVTRSTAKHERAPAAVSLPAPPSASALPTAVAPVPPVASAPAPLEPSAVVNEPEVVPSPRGKGGKPTKAVRGSKAVIPKVRVPVKAAGRDKEAELYGI